MENKLVEETYIKYENQRKDGGVFALNQALHYDVLGRIKDWSIEKAVDLAIFAMRVSPTGATQWVEDSKQQLFGISKDHPGYRPTIDIMAKISSLTKKEKRSVEG